ncbi:hypothetical protein EC988_000640 [Linderina pennispora]|nr:hypothetical protein EC988_000640 [Linderina pennispora]
MAKVITTRDRLSYYLCSDCTASFANTRLLYTHQCTSHSRYIVTFGPDRAVEFNDITGAGVRCFCGQVFDDGRLFTHAQRCDFCLAKADEPFASINDWDDKESDKEVARTSHTIFADNFEVIEDDGFDLADVTMTDQPTLLNQLPHTMQRVNSATSAIMPEVSSAVMRLLEDPALHMQEEQDTAMHAKPQNTQDGGIIEPLALKGVGLVVYEPLGLLICKSCHATIPPQTLKAHLHQYHSKLQFSEFFNATDGSAKVCVYGMQAVTHACNFVKENKALIKPFEAVRDAILRLPKPTHPVPLLPVLSRRGFSCKACGHVYIKRALLIKHLPECPLLGNIEKSLLDSANSSKYLLSHERVQRIWWHGRDTLYIVTPSPTTTPDGSDSDAIYPDQIGHPEGLPMNSDASDSCTSDPETKDRGPSLVNPQIVPRKAASLRTRSQLPEPMTLRNPLLAAARTPAMSLQKALVTATELFDSYVLGGLPVHDLTLAIAAGLADNPRCQDPGYSFLSDPRNKLDRYKHTLQQHLASSQFLSPTDYQLLHPQSAEALVARFQLRQWLAFTAQFVDILLLCLQLTGITAACGVPTEDIRFCNAEYTTRNLFASLGTLMVVNNDVTTGYLSAPFYLPAPLASLVVQYLAMVRPMELKAIVVLHKRRNPGFYADAIAAYSSFLFVREGRQIIADSY